MAVRCQHHGFLPIQATRQHLATVPVGDSMIRWFVGPLFFDASNPIIQGLKPLSSWMPDLADRIEQLNVWGFVGLFGHVWAMFQRFGFGDVVRLEQVLWDTWHHMFAGWMESLNTCEFVETSEGYDHILTTFPSRQLLWRTLQACPSKLYYELMSCIPGWSRMRFCMFLYSTLPNLDELDAWQTCQTRWHKQIGCTGFFFLQKKGRCSA